MKLKPGQTVLLPAYHCEAMVAPVRELKANAAFYRINLDTSIDFIDLRAQTDASVKAIMATHYFGFLQDLTELRAFCDERGILLIEDCAHAFFGRFPDGRAVGAVGDYAVASSMKFLPLYEGGILASQTIPLNDIVQSSPRLSFHFKSAFNIVERSLSYDRLGAVGATLNRALKAKDGLWRQLKKIRRQADAAGATPSSSDGGYGIDAEWLDKSPSWASQWIVRLSRLTQSAYLRRRNYSKLHAALASLPDCRPLFAGLPEDVAPWAYPLYVQNADACNFKLRMQGLPLWRFGEFLDRAVDEERCPVSVDYSRHIVQFPCHQSLTDRDIDWMVACITRTIKDG